MIVLLDTNVLVDVLLEREPFYIDAARLWERAEQKQLGALVCSLSLTTVYYLARRQKGRDAAKKAVQLIADVFQIAAVDRAVIDDALQSPLADLEDAVQSHCAVRSGASHIVTRDAHGFALGPLPALTPQQCLAALGAQRAGPAA
jgi:predicted nucleic acid-binding protein